MASKNKQLFNGLGLGLPTQEASSPAESTPVRERKKTNHFEQRENALSALVAGDVIEKTLFLVDPARCRMWSHHNRRYDLLSQARCQDLIDGLLSQGEQEIPAVVRKLKDDPNYDYEVIYGARRHWSVSWLRVNNYPNFKFLIEVRNLTDEEAFRLSDIENRDRKDITDYERAMDYANALGIFYHDSLRDMGKRLEMSHTMLANYLDLARLPQAIIDAYWDIEDIKEYHSRKLKPYIADQVAWSAILKEAWCITEFHQKVKNGEGMALTGSEVISRLLASLNIKDAVSKECVLPVFTGKKGAELLTVMKRNKKGITLRLSDKHGSEEEIIDAVRSLMEWANKS